MAETKAQVYERVVRELRGLLDGLEDPVAVMASTAALVHDALPLASWTGFYRVVGPDLLRIGPYQGPVGCVEIAFGKGVCGAAARDRETYVVPDVHAFSGHIACDTAARSEIVVPIQTADGSLAAVLDIDSREPAAFDEEDRRGLEAIAEILKEHFRA
ncbi:MAG: GAF domain-containing protein [Acidobacteriota bacterium]|nr:GAF domain-containing protein [Acidobacteriota bacterium]